MVVKNTARFGWHKIWNNDLLKIYILFHSCIVERKNKFFLKNSCFNICWDVVSKFRVIYHWMFGEGCMSKILFGVLLLKIFRKQQSFLYRCLCTVFPYRFLLQCQVQVIMHCNEQCPFFDENCFCRLNYKLNPHILEEVLSMICK